MNQYFYDTGFLFASPSFLQGFASAMDLGGTLVEYNNSATANNPDNIALQKDNPLQLVKQQISFSGPIPHPDLLAQYDQIIPNGADRILLMAEAQSRHRRLRL